MKIKNGILLLCAIALVVMLVPCASAQNRGYGGYYHGNGYYGQHSYYPSYGTYSYYYPSYYSYPYSGYSLPAPSNEAAVKALVEQALRERLQVKPPEIVAPPQPAQPALTPEELERLRELLKK